MSDIRTTGLRFARQGFELGPLDLELEPGSRCALVGPSGSGKSTLLRLLAGLERPRAGEIVIDGKVASTPRTLLDPSARGIGFVFQSGALWPHMTALRHLTFAAPRLGAAGALELLGRVGLAGKEGRRPAELSGGEAQRLGLARALAGTPRILLLDEPLQQLDAHLRDELAGLIREVALERNTTTLVVTHDAREAIVIAERALVIDGGRVIEAGPIERLRSAPQTALAASLFGNAVCLPLEDAGKALRSPFGELARPAGTNGPLALALLPGDVVVEARGATSAPGAGAEAVVLSSGRDGARSWLHVLVAGRSILAEGHQDHAPGARVRVVLRGAPRLLRAERRHA
jgi:iron(III) transport system ATP-binding protein